jgi:predicted nucleic acid-binding protein
LGELALGTLRQRRLILRLLHDLPQATLVREEEVLAFIERHELAGSGVGYIDAHLLSSSRLAAAPLWTRDKRLAEVAKRMRAAY